MHAHPCPAVISVQAPGRVEVWGIRTWFAGEPGDGVPMLPAADMADNHQRLIALLCRGMGLTVPLLPSTAGDEWQGGRRRADRCPQQTMPSRVGR